MFRDQIQIAAGTLLRLLPFWESHSSGQIWALNISQCYPLGRRVSPMYRTQEQTIPSYNQRASTLVPLIVSSKLHKALAAAVTLGTKCMKCGLNVHWLSMVRPRYFIRSPTSTFCPFISKHRPGGGASLRRQS